MRLAAELPIDRRGCPAGEQDRWRVAARRPRSGGSLHRSLLYHRQQSCHSGQVARQHRQFEVLVDPLDVPIHGLANSAVSLAPAEVLFDAFAFHLADAVAGVPQGIRASLLASATMTLLRCMPFASICEIQSPS